MVCRTIKISGQYADVYLLTVAALFFLLVSEISPPWQFIADFYLRKFRPLSEEASVGFLGAAMLWIATSILSTE